MGTQPFDVSTTLPDFIYVYACAYVYICMYVYMYTYPSFNPFPTKNSLVLFLLSDLGELYFAGN